MGTNQHLAINLKKLRMHFGLSQKAFGELFGLSRSNVQSYENGTKPNDERVLLKIAEYFKVDLTKILSSEIDFSESNTESTSHAVSKGKVSPIFLVKEAKEIIAKLQCENTEDLGRLEEIINIVGKEYLEMKETIFEIEKDIIKGMN